MRLVERNRAAPENPVVSLIAAPIMDKTALVGVIEAINKVDGTPFDDDELFALRSLTETASTALHNASLLLAERKVEILETLKTVSHEITSTLNLERMLQTIVDAPQAVIPYERAAILLAEGGRFKLSAVTGVTQVNADAPDIAPLNEILQWAALSEEVIHVRQHGEEIDSDGKKRGPNSENISRTPECGGFIAMPLNDDTGRVGMLAMESRIQIFWRRRISKSWRCWRAQATVALRNAQMYKEVPFISVLEPVLVRKRKFMAMEKRRRTVYHGVWSGSTIFPGGLPVAVARGWRCGGGPRSPGADSAGGGGRDWKSLRARRTGRQKGQVLAEMEAWDHALGAGGGTGKV